MNRQCFSCAAWTQRAVMLLILLMVGGMAQAGEASPGPVYSPSDSCLNIGSQGKGCECEEKSESQDCVNQHSFLFLSRLIHTHYATDDYTMGRLPSGSGCAPCGQVSGGAYPSQSLPTLDTTRFHSYHADNERHFASFGPGVYSAYDFCMAVWTWPVGPAKPVMWPYEPKEGGFFGKLHDDDMNGVFEPGSSNQRREGRMLTATGQTTVDPRAVAKVTMTTHEGLTWEFRPIPIRGRLGEDGLVLCRPERIVDPHGNAVVIAYLDAVPTTESAWPYSVADAAVYFRRSTVTDAYGRTMTYTYGPNKIGYGYPVTALTLPGGQQVTYQYNTTGTGLYGLVGVTYPNGDVSTFGKTYDPAAQANVISYDDAGAEDHHRRNQSYLSTATWVDPVTGQVFPQATERVRKIVNGDGETAFQSWVDLVPNTDSDYWLTYLMNQRVTRLRVSGWDGLSTRKEEAVSWSPTTSRTSWLFRLEETRSYDDNSRPAGSTDLLGRTIGYANSSLAKPAGQPAADPLSYATCRGPIRKYYPDATMSTGERSPFNTPTIEIDRTGVRTVTTYSTKGARLSRTVGEGTPLAATTTWTYNAQGQPLTETDPLGRVSTWVYNAQGYLMSTSAPADLAGGAAQVTTYEYQPVTGLLTASIDPSGRRTTYIYDARKRLIQAGYADGTVALTTYGTGLSANQIVSRTDRTGVRTDYGYDLSGRLTLVTEAANRPEALTTLTTYVSGTINQVATRTVGGDQTTSTYDSRGRQVATTQRTKSNQSLVTTYHLDALGRRLATTDAYGRKTFQSYDINDRVMRSVRELVPGGVAIALPNPDGDGTDIAAYAAALGALARPAGANPAYTIEDTTYDAEGRTLTRTDGRGNVASYAYDARGRIVSQTEATGTAVAATVLFQYDAVDNRTQVTDPRGVISQMTYTGRNLLKTLTEAVGTPIAATTTYTYSPTRKVATVTDALGRVTSNAYGVCCDYLVGVTDAAGFVTAFTNDSLGRRTAQTDPNGLITTWVYDGRGRMTQQANGAGEVTKIFYDENASDGIAWTGGSRAAALDADLGLGVGSDGMAVITVDPLGKASIRISDGVGRTVRSIDANGNASTMVYDTVTAAGLVETASADTLGRTTRQRSDGAGLPRESVDATNQITTQSFDANGNRVSYRDPVNVGLDCVFDARNRDTVCTDTRGAVTTKAYDANSNLVQVTDALNGTETTVYDARNRKTSTTDRINATTQFAYDLVGNLLTITDAQGGVTTYAYTTRNLLATETFPAPTGGTRSYTYDAGRRLATRQDQTGTVTTYQYDAANRLVTRAYPVGGNDTFAYDPVGRLTAAHSVRYANDVARSYDPAGRLTAESLSIDGVTAPVGYSYDVANQLTALTYPDRTQVTRGYDPRGLLASISRNGGDLVANRVYDNAGRLTQTAYGNGLVESRAYTPGDHLVSSIQTPGLAAAPAVTDFAYQYDLLKRKTRETALGINQDFSYDAQSRLTSWNRAADTQTWNLSPVGDWTTTTKNGVVENRTHTPVHELVSINGTALAYDPKGNLTKDEQNQQFVWDVENRLASATALAQGQGSVASYRYDALGRRVQKTVDGTSTTFISAGAQEVVEVVGDITKAPFALPSYGLNQPLSGPGRSPAGNGVVGSLLPTALARITFQPADSATPSGWTADVGDVLGGTRGWSVAWPKGIDRAVLADPLVDTFIPLTTASPVASATWTYKVPNGTYPVAVIAGDATSKNHTNHLTINGATLTDPDPATTATGYEQGDFDGWLTQVTVTSGTITISAAAGSFDPTLVTVEIGQQGSAITAAQQTALANHVAALTSATGAPITNRPTVYARVWGAYIDELITYTRTKPGKAAERFFAHSNSLFSVAAITNAAGQVVERSNYDAYGKRSLTNSVGATIATSTVGNATAFTGRSIDRETGLMHFRARMYSPAQGRFLTVDPLKYVNGASMYSAYFAPRFLDPFGLECKECEKPNPDKKCPSDADCIKDNAKIQRAKDACKLALELVKAALLQEALGAVGVGAAAGVNAVSRTASGLAAGAVGGAAPGVGMMPNSDPLQVAIEAAIEICSRPCCEGCKGPNPPPAPPDSPPPAPPNPPSGPGPVGPTYPGPMGGPPGPWG